MITLTQLNQMSQKQFVDRLGAIFEQTPEIASQTWQFSPFESIESLYRSMVAVVDRMSETEQLKLIIAHPDLGSKAKMARASVKEQTGAGLTQLQPEQYDRLTQLNSAYKQKFDFPFIIAVKNHSLESIFDAFTSRLKNSKEEEKEQALEEIKQIAWFRLENLVNLS